MAAVLLQKNIASSETVGVVTSTTAQRKALSRGQLLVSYTILYKLPFQPDVHRFFFPGVIMVKTKTQNVGQE